MFGVTMIRPELNVRLVRGPKAPLWVRIREWLKWDLPELLLWWVLFAVLAAIGAL
jgi:hypothetical protein